MRSRFLLIVTSVFTLVGTAQAQSIAGEWDAAMNTPGSVRNFKIVFNVSGDSLTGTVKRQAADVPLVGTIKDNVVRFGYTVNYNGNPLQLTVTATVTGDSMKGTVAFGVQVNVDNGSGRIQGIYLHGNERVRSIFEAWLAPFADLDATTITVNNEFGVDAIAFDQAGLPGFQFIQDPLDYETRTHHSNMDVFDRLVADDMRRNTVILASMVYHAAMRDEPLPREGR